MFFSEKTIKKIAGMTKVRKLHDLLLISEWPLQMSHLHYGISINKNSSHTYLTALAESLQSYNNQKAITFNVTLNVRRIASPIRSDPESDPIRNPILVLLRAPARQATTRIRRLNCSESNQLFCATLYNNIIH